MSLSKQKGNVGGIFLVAFVIALIIALVNHFYINDGKTEDELLLEQIHKENKTLKCKHKRLLNWNLVRDSFVLKGKNVEQVAIGLYSTKIVFKDEKGYRRLITTRQLSKEYKCKEL